MQCFAGSQCSPRRYILICRSNRQQLKGVFLNNMKVLFLGWNHVLLCREQRRRGEPGFAAGNREAACRPRSRGTGGGGGGGGGPLQRSTSVSAWGDAREPQVHDVPTLLSCKSFLPPWKSSPHQLWSRASYPFLLQLTPTSPGTPLKP